MQTTILEDASCQLRDALSQLDALEAAYIKQCCLEEPRQTLKAFAQEHALAPKEMADLRVRAMEHLRGSLAEKNIHRLTDIL